MEVAPFMMMNDERVAVEALAEYALFQESPKLANVAFIENSFERTFGGPFQITEATGGILTTALNANSSGWLRFLAPDTLRRLRAESASTDQQVTTSDAIASVVSQALAEDSRIRQILGDAATTPHAESWMTGYLFFVALVSALRTTESFESASRIVGHAYVKFVQRETDMARREDLAKQLDRAINFFFGEYRSADDSTGGASRACRALSIKLFNDPQVLAKQALMIAIQYSSQFDRVL